MATQQDISRLSQTGATQLQGVVLPKIPYTNLPEDVVKRVPQLQTWYDQFHRDMDKWREDMNRVLKGTAIT